MSYREYTDEEASELMKSKFCNSFIRIRVDNMRVNYAFFDFIDFAIHGNKTSWVELLEWFDDNIKTFYELKIEMRVYKEDGIPINVCMALSYMQFSNARDFGIHVLNCALSSMLDEIMHHLLQ